MTLYMSILGIYETVGDNNCYLHYRWYLGCWICPKQGNGDGIRKIPYN